MNIGEFEAEFRSISKTFGEKNYPEERRYRIFEAMKELSAAQFRMVVGRILDTSKYTPLGDDFRDAARGFLQSVQEEKRSSLDERIANLSLCERCDNSGVLLAHSTCRMKYKYAFRCECRAAKMKNYKLPLFSPREYPELKIVKRHDARGAINGDGPISPWPAHVEGLMLSIASNRKGIEFGCRMLGLTQKEAWELYELFIEKKFDDGLATFLLAKVPSVNDTITNIESSLA